MQVVQLLSAHAKRSLLDIKLLNENIKYIHRLGGISKHMEGYVRITSKDKYLSKIPKDIPLYDFNKQEEELQVPFKLDEEVSVKIIDTDLGDGFGVYQGWIVLVKGGVQNQDAKIKIEAIIPGFARGRLLNPTIETKCPHFYNCSGCQMQHLPYNEQLQQKKQRIHEIITNTDINVSPLVLKKHFLHRGEPFEYKNNMTIHIPTIKPKESIESIYIHYSAPFQKPPDITSCPISRPSLNQVLSRQRKQWKGQVNHSSEVARHASVNYRESLLPPAGMSLSYYMRNKSVLPMESTVVEGSHPCIQSIKGRIFRAEHSTITNVVMFGKISSHIHSLLERLQMKYLVCPNSGLGHHPILHHKLFQQVTAYEDAVDQREATAYNMRLNHVPKNKIKLEQHPTTVVKKQNEKRAERPGLLKEALSYDPDETVFLLQPPAGGIKRAFMSDMVDFGPKWIVGLFFDLEGHVRHLEYLTGVEKDGKDRKIWYQQTGGSKNYFYDGRAPLMDDKVQIGGSVYSIENITSFDYSPQTIHSANVILFKRL